MWATAPGPGIFGFRIPVKHADALTFQASSRSAGSDMSFVSITFDKCRYRLPKFDAAVGGASPRAVVS
jgi:hypothetical protein